MAGLSVPSAGTTNCKGGIDGRNDRGEGIDGRNDRGGIDGRNDRGGG